MLSVKTGESKATDLGKEDAATIAGLLKAFLNQLGTSVHDAMKLLSRLNPGNLHILRFLLRLLSDVASTATSKMNAETLGTSLFCMFGRVADRAAKAAAIVPSPSPSPDLSAIAKCNRFISLMIENAHKVAEELGNLLRRKTT